ncbi:DsbC family protein [Vreelandella utahensis]|uniref:DsbC family protein n=1 Tax=Vreelandella halophila TaxID=86177 RepID=UPI000984FA94|nr:DsbC family protein [Halomonas utahensis]
MRRLSAAFLLLVAGLLATAACAKSAEERIRERLEESVPDMPVDSIRETEREGLYAVQGGGNLIYTTADGRYLFTGQMLRLGDDGITNLTEQSRTQLRRETVAELDRSEMIRFGPEEDEIRADLYVFTDTTCGYCRKLHRDMEALNDLGIRVNYLAYPRGGPGSKGARQLNAVWCSEDRRSAMTRAKQGESVSSEQCDSPVQSHFRMGRTFGVSGTPALVTESGRMIRGYKPPRALAQELGLDG